MNSLRTIIKLKKKTLDELRIKITELYQDQQNMIEARTSIENSIEEQKRFLDNHPDLIYDFIKFSDKSKFAISALNQKINQINNEIDYMRELIYNSFSELKQLEIALDIQIEKERKTQQQKENIIFDEIGINIHLKNNINQ